jgi:hypothetical protein
MAKCIFYKVYILGQKLYLSGKKYENCQATGIIFSTSEDYGLILYDWSRLFSLVIWVRVRVIVLNATFSIFQFNRGRKFYWWMKPAKNRRPVASH